MDASFLDDNWGTLQPLLYLDVECVDPPANNIIIYKF